MATMRQLRGGAAAFTLASLMVACSSSNNAGTGGAGAGTSASSGGTGGKTGTGGSTCASPGATGIAHVVIIVQENHTFDTYFGNWCTAATGSNPTCTAGPSCCEAAPATDPTGAMPVALDDTQNAAYDPNHTQACELAEMDMGKMDAYVTGSTCAKVGNFAIAPVASSKPYQDLATQYAIADRYFQPIAGQSSSNDMYLAVAKEVFIDNAYEPVATGSSCEFTATMPSMMGQKTIADLLTTAGKTVGWYGEGYDHVKMGCNAPADCPLDLPLYPCLYDPADVPFLYYDQFATSTTFVRDYTQLATDLAANTLPDVSYVKALGYHSEHPGYGDTISAGTTFVTGVIQAINDSCYKDDTLILLTWDEGGGFFDHIAPPPTSTVDNQPYGTRIPLLAIGRFAKKGAVSHVTMEHSSIVKFLEWNYLAGKTGQLQARDATVNNIGSLLDPAETGVTIPDM
jgi:phospholipase C